ncbi:archease [Nonomuraea sp. K274]|uniref:Archease n=1 Tax=Nonomuraea cypriaca TaxID=1187855 RepID=A0A931EVZ7_9ACTN|nr:archease [Nonomuraea cypriaca]MBF8184685.1 archease [Nonomuraea cypriaca]
MSRGHRAVAHTADIALEAWADTREECLAEAVRALVESFADISHVPPGETVPVSVTGESDEAMLAAVLQEVLYQVEVHDRVAVDASVGERAEVRLRMVPVETVEQVGAMPKAIAVHELRFGQAGKVWQAHVVVDV